MTRLTTVLMLWLCTVALAQAGQVEIVKTEFTRRGEGGLQNAPDRAL